MSKKIFLLQYKRTINQVLIRNIVLNFHNPYLEIDLKIEYLIHFFNTEYPANFCDFYGFFQNLNFKCLKKQLSHFLKIYYKTYEKSYIIF